MNCARNHTPVLSPSPHWLATETSFSKSPVKSPKRSHFFPLIGREEILLRKLCGNFMEFEVKIPEMSRVLFPVNGAFT